MVATAATRDKRSSLDEVMARSERHLIMVHQPGQQAIADFRQIATQVRRIDPKIGVFIVSAISHDEALATVAAGKPTLVFSPSNIGQFAPKRGKIYQGQVIPKFVQLKRLSEAGVPVPATQVLQPGMSIDPGKWGPFVVVKPLDIVTSSKGLGIQLMRTERVQYIAPQDYPADHPGRRGPMVVQQFIDSGPLFSSYRVLSLFGYPLYCIQIQSSVERVKLSASDNAIESSPIATVQDKERRRSFIYKADLLALARDVDKAIPEVPLKGIDIIRDARTGRLFVLEINPGGNTWHFSSRHNAQVRANEGADYVRKLYEQLDAIGTAAQALVEVTRREAI